MFRQSPISCRASRQVFGTALVHREIRLSEIVDRLNREINAILQDSKLKTRLAELGVTGTGGSPETFGKIIADETEKWGKVVRSAGIKPE